MDVNHMFKNDFIGKDGFPVFSINSETGEHIDKNSSISELGDYLPFMMYYKEKWFCREQLELVNRHFKENKFIWNNHTKLPKHSLAFEYTDLILGLLLCYQLSKDNDYLDTALYVFDFVKNNFSSKSHYFPVFKTLPFVSPICSMYSELAVDIYKETDDVSFLDYAEKQIKMFSELRPFKKYGILPLYYPIRFEGILGKLPFTKRYYLTKYNTHFSHALINLYRNTQDKKYLNLYERWFKGIEMYMKKDNIYYQILSQTKDIKTGLNLTNFHIIESLCDMYEVSKDEKYLNQAILTSKQWLSKQGKTGVLPSEYNGIFSLLDNNTDFCVCLVKLYELTKDRFFLEKFNEIQDGVNKYHSAKFGFYDSININDGRNNGNTIETRYISLSLKCNILKENDFKSYGNGVLQSLIRDR